MTLDPKKGPFFLRAFQFRVTLVQSGGGALLCEGGFQEVSGLEVGMEAVTRQEGGSNYQELQFRGRARYQPLVLRRGMLYIADGRVNNNLWVWMQNLIRGKTVRCDGVIEVVGVEFGVTAQFMFVSGLPTRVRGPDLNARSGEIAIEELHIAHQGLMLKK